MTYLKIYPKINLKLVKMKKNRFGRTIKDIHKSITQ